MFFNECFSISAVSEGFVFNMLLSLDCFSAFVPGCEDCKGQLIKYNKSISRLNVAIRDDEIRFRERQRQEEAVYNAKLRAEIRREEEEAEEARRIRKEKFALKLEEKRIELADRQKIQTKLPKLEISKFQGTHLDWTRFWSLFESQIDNSEISDEAKFPI